VHSRPLEERDLPRLREIYERLPYKFDGGFPDFLSAEYESAEVVVDADDRPLMVAGAKRAIELVMICDPARPVLVRLHGIALLHERLRVLLERLGLREAGSFIPPQIEKTHGRTMERRFGWLPAWKGYRVT
jgi:hypothetical protein